MTPDRSTVTAQQVLPTPRIIETSVRSMPLRLCAVGTYLDDIAGRLDTLEPATLDWIDGFGAGEVFYDIGASFGLYALYAGLARASRVVAFEPEAQNMALLEMNHHLNRHALQNGMTTLNVALGDEARLGSLFIRRYEAGLAMKILDRPVRRLETQAFDPAHVQPVLEDRLDDLVSRYGLPAPTHIKIDVDGAEDKVLRGAAATLRSRHTRSVLVEVQDPGGEGAAVLSALEEAGLRYRSEERVEDFDRLVNMVYERPGAP